MQRNGSRNTKRNRDKRYKENSNVFIKSIAGWFQNVIPKMISVAEISPRFIINDFIGQMA